MSPQLKIVCYQGFQSVLEHTTKGGILNGPSLKEHHHKTVT